MENISLFLIALFGTLIITRTWTYLFHDKNGYKKKNGEVVENSKTITAYLRKKTKRDLHHIHIGLGVLLVSVVWIIHSGYGKTNLSFLGIGLSMVSDQMFLFVNSKDYFEHYFESKNIIASIILHIVIALVALIIWA